MSYTCETILLSVLNWLHLFATVAWIGGITYIFFILVPVARKTLEPPLMGKLMMAVTLRFRILVYVCMVALIGTGIGIQQLSMGYLIYDFGNIWSVFLFIKHIIFLVMIIIGIIVAEGMGPKIAKLTAKGPSPEVARLQKTQMSLAVVNLFLGIITLVLTGILSAIA
ncbi:MAG: DUF4149 domain-containing protein [Candidatus Aminicenantaceae bacterium]